jgi:glucose/arabinose dehydrogenase
LNRNRTDLLLSGPLADKIADNRGEHEGIIFGQGFGGITDMQVGPDGYLYVLSLSSGGDDCLTNPKENCIDYNLSNKGSIYRIRPH